MRRVALICLPLGLGLLWNVWSSSAQEPVAVALPAAKGSDAKGAAAAPKLKLQPLTVSVQLDEIGTRFTGTLSGLDQWPMKTSFGETNVPLSAVAGIKFAGAGTPVTTIVLHNGDSITGALELNHVLIETSWGKAEIDSGHITSMLFSPGLSWTTEPGLSGNRWKLVADKDRQPARPPSGNTTTSPASSVPSAPTPIAVPTPSVSSASTQPTVSSPLNPQFPSPNFGQPTPRPLVIGR